MKKIERREFEMTEEQHARILDACRPVPYLVIGGREPASPQDNANAAWVALGQEMGFDGMTVEPVAGKGQRVFTAIPMPRPAATTTGTPSVNGVNDKTGLLDAPPEQPTLPDTLAEPMEGAETVMEEVRGPGAEPPFQPPLVPMSDDELREAGHKLAVEWGRLAEMKAHHKTEREEMRHDEERQQAKVENLANVIRTQGR